MTQPHSCAYIRETSGPKGRTLPMFTAAGIRKPPRRPLTDGWIKKMWSGHTTGYHSATTRRETAICSKVHGLRERQTERSGRGGEVPHASHAGAIHKTETGSQTRRMNSRLRGKAGRGVRECGLHRPTAPYLKQMAAQDLAQRHGAARRGGERGENALGAVWRSPLAVHLKLPQHC